MGQDSGGPPPPTATAKRSALSADEVRVFADRAPRCMVALQVLCTIPGEGEDAEFLEAELVNVSSSGMLVTGTPVADRRGRRIPVQARRRPGGAVRARRGGADRRGAAAHGSQVRHARRRRAHPRTASDRSRRRGARDSDRARVRAARRRVRTRIGARAAHRRDRELLHVQPAAARGHRGLLPAGRDRRSPRDRLPDGHSRRRGPPARAMQGEGGREAGSVDWCALSRRSNGARCRRCAPRSRSWRAAPTG